MSEQFEEIETPVPATARHKIDWHRLVSREYFTDLEFEVFNWLLKTGQPFYIPRKNWNYGQPGIDQLMYGYSANNHKSYTDFGREWHRTLELGFYRAVFSRDTSYSKRWRDQERIRLGKSRWLTFPNWRCPIPREWRGTADAMHRLYWYKGRSLKKELHQPDYPDRLNPVIHHVNFSTAGDGYQYSYYFNFDDDEGSYWGRSIRQQEGEAFDAFLFRAHSLMLGQFSELKETDYKLHLMIPHVPPPDPAKPLTGIFD